MLFLVTMLIGCWLVLGIRRCDQFGAFFPQALDEMAALFTAGKLSAHVDRAFGLDTAAQAFNYSAGPGEGGVGEHIGKISIVTAGG